MSAKIKILFVDFWWGFVPEESYFYDMMGGDSAVEISATPDILFHSNFGVKHREYGCFKVFFSSENERPCFFTSDVVLSSDYSNHSRHFRLPLFVFYAHRFNQSLLSFSNLSTNFSIEDWSKRKFCCFLVSNPKSSIRLKFFDFLNSKRRVDSGGKVFNNIGYKIEHKLDFIKDYKFVIAFENSKRDGYTTEKIFEPFLVNSIPIYWGNRRVSADFNKDSFVDVSEFRNFQDVYDHLQKIENSVDLASKMIISKEVLPNDYIDSENVRNFIINQFNDRSLPVSQVRLYRLMSFIRKRFDYFYYFFKVVFKLNFR